MRIGVGRKLAGSHVGARRGQQRRQERRHNARHPLDESAQARLVRACHGAGQRACAFEVYRSTRRRLAEELGVDPAPELVSAYQMLLRGDADPARI